MKFVETTQYQSETLSLRREVVLLRILVGVLLAFFVYRDIQIKSRLTPQAVYEACNKGIIK